MLIIAIDPGATGGLALYNTLKSETPVVTKMPGTPLDIFEFLQGARTMNRDAVAVVEKINTAAFGFSAPSTIAKLNRHIGHLEMALLALNMPIIEVTPQKWMKHLGKLPKDKGARKSAIKDQMQRRYPLVKLTLWNADALGILTWYMETQTAKGTTK